MAKRKSGEVHWIVRTNRKSRTFLALLLFATIAAHFLSEGRGALAWSLLFLQYIVYPQLAYLSAARARRQLAAERIIFLADPFILGVWSAALGFPAWISFTCFATVTFTHAVYYRWKGALQAVAMMALGALLVMVVMRPELSPATAWPATLLSMATLTLYVLQVAERANFRAVTLHEARDRLRKSEHLLKLKLDEIESLQAQLHEQALRDPLTGLYNRRYLGCALERELARCLRTGEPLSALMLDVDHFKRINDSLGHQAGDEVLKTLASMVKDQIRPSDVACRYGGEEFIILMPGMPAEVACERGERLRAAFAATPLVLEGRQVSVTISVGIADSAGCARAEDLVRCADTALYQAKAEGRNRVQLARTVRASPLMQLQGHC